MAPEPAKAMANLVCTAEKAEERHEPVSMLLSFSQDLFFVPMELADGVKHPQIERVHCNEFDFALF